MINKFDNKASVSASDFDGLFLGLNNGDKTALEQAVARWNLKDEQSLLKFVMAILLKADGNRISVNVGGIQTNITPDGSLLKERAPNTAA